MTPERMAGLVTRWVRRYTRDLPPPAAERRIDEIDADLHDHIAHERAHGTPERRIALSIAGRMVRGLPADAAWRRSIARSSKRKDAMKHRRLTSRPGVRVALATAGILLLLLATMALAGELAWSVADFVLAAVLLGGTGMLLELGARKPRSLVFRIAAGAVAVAAIVLGEADDAPGLVLFGCLLIAGTIALALRTAQRSE